MESAQDSKLDSFTFRYRKNDKEFYTGVSNIVQKKIVQYNKSLFGLQNHESLFSHFMWKSLLQELKQHNERSF